MNPSEQKALILGNGPSLDLIDFQNLKQKKNIKTFTCNRIAKLCKEKKWSVVKPKSATNNNSERKI